MDDIEDGEILEDDNTPVGQIVVDPRENRDFTNEFSESLNESDKLFFKNKSGCVDERDSCKISGRIRTFSDSFKKRRRSDVDGVFRNEDYYSKRSKRDKKDHESEEETNFVSSGSRRDSERNVKSNNLSDDRLHSIMYDGGENEDPRPFSNRSPIRRDRVKKDRGLIRSVGLSKRRGRGGSILRHEKMREIPNDMCIFFIQGHCQRGSECPYSHSYNQPRKLEVCKFYLNDCCTKRDKCIYMHSDFPCKYFHLPGLNCNLGKSCKFSHSKLDEIQRAVLKKYADIPIKEMDEMQKLHRDRNRDRDRGDLDRDRNKNHNHCEDTVYSFGSGSGSNSNISKKEKRDSNQQIPSLFDIRIGYPSYSAESGDEGPRENEAAMTPIPSPQSMMHENDEDDEKFSYLKMNHNHKVLSEYNDHKSEQHWDVEISTNIEHNVTEAANHKSHHKKKSKKSEDHDDDKSKRHSDKKKRKSKKGDKDGEKEKKKKKKKEQKRLVDKCDNMATESFTSKDECSLDGFEANDIREPMEDAFSHLPKKQQELYLRIQQHQKEAEASQNSNVEDEDNEVDSKTNVNWYSSDEEEPVTNHSSVSPLATLLRTIQTSTIPVPDNEKQSRNRILPSSDTDISVATDPLPIVDASQLANIDLSDEVAMNLTSIIRTVSTSGYHESLCNSSMPEPEERNFGKYSLINESMNDVAQLFPKRQFTVDCDVRFSNSVLTDDPLFHGTDNPSEDIDVRQLPFKPVPVHDAANEIDASITSHPPIEYKLKPLTYISKVDYASMSEVSKICVNDPRFMKKSGTISQPSATTVDVAHVGSIGINPNDPRHSLLKTTPDAIARTDPRLSDVRYRTDPRLSASSAIGAAKHDPRVDKDVRDPRLFSRCKLKDPSPYQMAAAVATTTFTGSMHPVILQPQIPPSKESSHLRKEDPRLRFRSNQNI